MNQTINYVMRIVLTIDDIKKGTVTDPVLSQVIKIMKNDRWYELDKLSKVQETNKLKQYRKTEILYY